MQLEHRGAKRAVERRPGKMSLHHRLDLGDSQISSKVGALGHEQGSDVAEERSRILGRRYVRFRRGRSLEVEGEEVVIELRDHSPGQHAPS